MKRSAGGPARRLGRVGRAAGDLAGWLRKRARRTILAVLFAAILAIIALSCIPTERSFVVAAETYGLESTQLAELAGWRLKNATVCNRREPGLPGVAQKSDPPGCSSELYAITTYPVLDIDWPAATKFVLRRPPGEAGIAIEIDKIDGPALRLGGESVRPGSRILLPDTEWQELGVLVLRGAVTIGSLEPLARSHTITGHYEVREKLTWRDAFVVVAEGDLLPADRVTIVDRRAAATAQGGTAKDEAAFVQGMASVNPDPGRDGFQVVLYSGAGHGFLRLERMGGADPAYIGSSWYEKAQKDPLLLALTAALTLTVLALELWSKVAGLLGQGRHD